MSGSGHVYFYDSTERDDEGADLVGGQAEFSDDQRQQLRSRQGRRRHLNDQPDMPEDDPINHIQGNSIDDTANIDPVRKAEIDKQFIDDSLPIGDEEV